MKWVLALTCKYIYNSALFFCAVMAIVEFFHNKLLNLMTKNCSEKGSIQASLQLKASLLTITVILSSSG